MEFGEQSSATRGQFLSCVIPNQSQRSFESIGSDGQRRSPEAGSSEVVLFTASTGSVAVKQGKDSSRSEPIQGLCEMQCEAAVPEAVYIPELIQEAVEGKGEDGEAAVPEAGLGNSCSMQCEAIGRQDGIEKFGGVADSFCLDEVQVNHSLGGVLSIGDRGFATHDPSRSRDRTEMMVLEGGVAIEEPQC